MALPENRVSRNEKRVGRTGDKTFDQASTKVGCFNLACPGRSLIFVRFGEIVVELLY